MKHDLAVLGVGISAARRYARHILFGIASLLAALAAGANASTYYVDAGQADDTGDGLSWPTAMKQIQTAIDSSAAGDTILVKNGTYFLTTALVLQSNRRITSDDGANDSWDSAVYNDSLCVIDASNTSRVVTITGVGVSGETRIRGLKMTGGRATAESPGAGYGGGVYIDGGADPVIEHCWITGNKATASGTGYGGGIACRGSGTEPVIDSNLIEDNVASTSWYGYGGGIYCNQLTMCGITNNTITDNVASTVRAGFGGGICCSESRVDIHDNSLIYNIAAGPAAYGGEGGGVYVYRGTVNIRYGSFMSNRAAEGNGRSGKGGGMFTSGSGNILIEDITHLDGNMASTNGPGYGGGIYCGSGNTTIRSIYFWGNKAAAGSDPGDGGGLYLVLYGGTVVQNSRFLGNCASTNGTGRGGAIYTATSAQIEQNIIHSNVASDSSEGYGGGLYLGNATSLQFTNNTVYGNRNTRGPLGSGTGSGLYHESGGSLTIANNIVAGHNKEHSDSVGMHFSLPTTIRNNCFHDNPGGHYNANVTSIEEILADPRLTDPGNLDFSLMYDSPCIEEGDPSYAVPENGAWVVDIGAIEYTGTRHWRPITGTGEYLFGGRVKAKVNVTTLGTLSEIDMVVHPGETHPMGPVSVARWYEIDHVGTGMEFDLTLTYFDEELNGRTEDHLVLWRWDGLIWDGPKTYSARDLDHNWITVSGQTNFSDWILTDEWGPTGIDETLSRFRLYANYPNPFNPATTISYELARPCHVRLDVYNAAGQLVTVLVDADKGAGPHRVEWEGLDRQGRQAASGVYFYRLRTGEFEQARKMVLVR